MINNYVLICELDNVDTVLTMESIVFVITLNNLYYPPILLVCTFHEHAFSVAKQILDHGRKHNSGFRRIFNVDFDRLLRLG